MYTVVSTATRRIGAGIAAFLVAKLGLPEEAAQQVVIAGGVFAGLAIDGIVTALLAKFAR